MFKQTPLIFLSLKKEKKKIFFLFVNNAHFKTISIIYRNLVKQQTKILYSKNDDYERKKEVLKRKSLKKNKLKDFSGAVS